MAKTTRKRAPRRPAGVTRPELRELASRVKGLETFVRELDRELTALQAVTTAWREHVGPKP